MDEELNLQDLNFSRERLFYSDDQFGNLIMMIKDFDELQIKLITKFNYIEEIENDNVICRCMIGGEQFEMAIDELDPLPELIIIGERQIDRVTI